MTTACCGGKRMHSQTETQQHLPRMATSGVSISARSWLGACSVYTAAVMPTTLAIVAAVTKVWRPLLSCRPIDRSSMHDAAR